MSTGEWMKSADINPRSFSIQDDWDLYLESPEKLLDLTRTQLFSIPAEQAEQFRLAVARRRFNELRSKVAMLDSLAANQGIDMVDSFDALAPLLFKHEVYKSYPLSWLEREDFPKLTRWLGKLTSVDVSAVDASGCSLIEEWFELLRRETPLCIGYSAGADGKMSFLVRTVQEWDWTAVSNERWRLPFGEDDSPLRLREGDRVPMLVPGPRYGNRPMNFTMDSYERKFGKGLVSTPDEKLDADLMSLAGRVQAASRKGEGGVARVNPKLLARKDEIARIRSEGPQRYDRWLSQVVEQYRGKRIYIVGTFQMVYDLALKLREKGVSGCFAPNSIITCGGGFPGGQEPANWKDIIREHVGVPVEGFMILYGMGELITMMWLCSEGKYHVPLTTTPFVLDVRSGQPLPRSGRQQGRFAFFDLLAETYWGGYVSGDEVTINWDEKCRCGQTSPFLDEYITKVSEDGEDRIGCAGTAKAHDDAIEFLLQG